MSRRTAYLLIRDLPHYRQEVFRSGLELVGFNVTTKPPIGPVRQGDALVIWNRYGVGDILATRFEKSGGLVFVAENGYLDFQETKKTFALALNRHNGLGRFPLDVGRSARLPEPAPWRECDQGDALLLPQRGIGIPGVAMPRAWPIEVVARLRQAGFSRSIRTRPHPGGNKNGVPFVRDLEGVAFAVTWGSSAGIKALMAGVPVLYELNGWVGGLGALHGVEHWRGLRRSGRRHMLGVVASAQCSDEEVMTGEPFKRLIELHNRELEGK